MFKTLRRNTTAAEPTLAQAFRPVLIHLGLKLAFMALFRAAIRRALVQMEAEGKL